MRGSGATGRHADLKNQFLWVQIPPSVPFNSKARVTQMAEVADSKPASVKVRLFPRALKFQFSRGVRQVRLSRLTFNQEKREFKSRTPRHFMWVVAQLTERRTVTADVRV